MTDHAAEEGRRSGWRRAALYLGGVLGPFGGGMVVVLIPEFREAFGVSSGTASLSITLYLVPFAALQLVSGTIGEYFGRERILRIAFIVYALASLLTAVVSSIELFLVGRALQGAANAFTTPLILAALAEATDENVIGRTMGTYASVLTAGMVMSPLIAGLAGAIDYRLAFVAVAIAATALAVIVPHGRSARVTADPPRLRAAMTPITAWLSSAWFFFFLSTVGFGVVVSLRAADEFGVGPDARGVMLAGFGLVGMLIGRPSGKLVDKLGQRTVMTGGVIIASALLVLLAFAPGAVILALLWSAMGGAAVTIGSPLSTLMVTASDVNRAGVISIVGAVRFTGSAIAPVIWIPIYHADHRLAFLLAATAVLGVIFTFRRAVGLSVGPVPAPASA